MATRSYPIKWSDDFVGPFDANALTVEALRAELRAGRAGYVVLQRWQYFYIYTWAEITSGLTNAVPTISVADALQMHEDESGGHVVLDDKPVRRRVAATRADKLVAVGIPSGPRRVGPGREVSRARPDLLGRQRTSAKRDIPYPESRRMAAPKKIGGHEAERKSKNGGGTARTATAVAVPDEGTTALRYPSIETTTPARAGKRLTVRVDLARERDTATETEGTTFAGLPAGWSSIPVRVDVFSPQLEFADKGNRGTVVVRRNANSKPASLRATVRSDATSDFEILALFSHDGRHAGSGRRTIPLGGAAGRESGPPPPAPGPVATDVSAPAADLTVKIFHQAGTSPGALLWSLDVRQPFDGLPPKLSEVIDIGDSAADYAKELFEACATLTPEKHMATLNGMGAEIYEKTPQCFRTVYWLLRRRLGPRFSIQFVSDDPHVPWELMRPSEGGKQADVLAIDHPVGRWLEGYRGYMTNRLPKGRVVTIAPKYSTIQDELPEAQTEAETLTTEFGALRLTPATVAGMSDLMKQGIPGERIGVVHFAGHGKFAAVLANNSSIDLEDGPLSVFELKGLPVGIAGQGRSRPVILFNACETANINAVLGQVGGWAELFMASRCSAFVAPLWRVYDDEALEVTTKLLEAVITREEPIGPALQSIRIQNRGRSPTFFAYVLYGDVMAHVA